MNEKIQFTRLTRNVNWNINRILSALWPSVIQYRPDEISPVSQCNNVKQRVFYLAYPAIFSTRDKIINHE